MSIATKEEVVMVMVMVTMMTAEEDEDVCQITIERK